MTNKTKIKVVWGLAYCLPYKTKQLKKSFKVTVYWHNKTILSKNYWYSEKAFNSFYNKIKKQWNGFVPAYSDMMKNVKY